MKDGCFQGSGVPWACAAAMTSVAASSTTLKLSSSNWRMIAVLPAPGAPVMMNLFIRSVWNVRLAGASRRLVDVRADLVARAIGAAAAHQVPGLEVDRHHKIHEAGEHLLPALVAP